MFGIDAAVTNVGNFVSELFGRRYDRKNLIEQRKYDRDRFVRLSEDAKKAGIHPLYAMGAGTTSSAIQTTPRVPTAKPDIGRSIAQMGQQEFTGLQKELLTAQINGVKIDNVTKAHELEMDFGKSVKPAPTNSNDMKIGGHAVKKNKEWSDAQIIEDRYGDVVSWAYGLGVVGADLYTAIKNKYDAPDGDIKKIMKEIESLKGKGYQTPQKYRKFQR